MAHLEVELVAADRKVWSGQASAVSAPAVEGDVGIRPGHAPLLAIMKEGTVRITPLQGSVRHVRVDSGFLSVDADQVTVVVDHAERAVEAGPAATR